MNKDQILHAIRDGLNRGVITKGDLQNISSGAGGASLASGQSAARDTIVSRVLYALGGIIALIGILVLVSDNWRSLGTGGRVTVALGFSLITYVSAIVLYKKGIQSALVQIFFVLSAAVSPFAAYTLLDALSVATPFSSGHQIFVALALLAIYAYALYFTKRNTLHVVCGLMFSWAYFATVGWMIKNSGIFWQPDAIRDITVYAAMILGFAFLAYRTWLKATLKSNFSVTLRRVSTIYNVAAFVFVLIPALALEGAWDLLYAFLALGAVMLSINLRTTSGLVVTAAAIAFYIVHMSTKYFANSVGWAAALVIIGFIIIGLGYLTYYLNKKYIAKA